MSLAQQHTHDDTDDEFHKSVAFEKADSEKQIAFGAVLVPDRVDHQADFFRADTIEQLASGFEDRVESSDAVPGVMHAVFPDHIELAYNAITEEKQTFGDRDLPAGSWVQGWKFNNDELWSLVEDGILSGYSIGGTIEGRVHYEAGTHPDDVEFPDEVMAEIEAADIDPADTDIFEVVGGRIMEVSTVDMPAVPDATHESYKSTAKAADALTSSVVDARLYLEHRGHDPDDAKRLAEYLIDQKTREPTGWIERAKRFFTGSGAGVDDGDRQNQRQPANETKMSGTEKTGRTLSAKNIASAMAAHDAAIDLLNRSDLDHGRVRFTDDSAHEFSVTEYGTSDELAESSVGDGNDETMNDELKEKFESFDERFDEIEETMKDIAGDEDEPEPDTDKSAVDGLAETVEQLATNQERMAETIERMANAQGASQQADTGADTSGDGDEKTWGTNSPFAVGGGR